MREVIADYVAKHGYKYDVCQLVADTLSLNVEHLIRNILEDSLLILEKCKNRDAVFKKLAVMALDSKVFD